MLEGEDTDAEDEAEVHRDLDEDLHDEVAATGAEQEATQAADQDMDPADAGAACMNGCFFSFDLKGCFWRQPSVLYDHFL